MTEKPDLHGAPALRGVYLAVGLLFVALGFVGAFLPVLPTTPFLILAAACFARSSRQLESWLLDHPRFVPTLRDWRERGAIPDQGEDGVDRRQVDRLHLVLVREPSRPDAGNHRRGTDALRPRLCVHEAVLSRVIQPFCYFPVGRRLRQQSPTLFAGIRTTRGPVRRNRQHDRIAFAPVPS